MSRPDFDQERTGKPADPVEEAILRRTEGFMVFGPEECLAAPLRTAEIMIKILAANYGTHNLTADAQKLAEDVQSGKIKPFICADREGKPFSCAALIELSTNDVEIGRGASLLPGKNQGGALPILLAFKAWKENQVFPKSQVLRAEVRTAKPTKEVPGGQETQSICLKTLRLIPTAIAPLFHHGIPDRQEMFFLASRFKNNGPVSFSPQIAPLPERLFDTPEHRFLFSFFWANFFGRCPSFFPSPETDFNLDALRLFTSRYQGPLLIIKSSEVFSDQKIDSQVIKVFQAGVRFALAKISLTTNQPESVFQQAQILKRIGFRVIGFEPSIKDSQLEIDLLLGSLSPTGKQRLVAPSFIESHFSHEIEDLLLADFIQWRMLTPSGGF